MFYFAHGPTHFAVAVAVAVAGVCSELEQWCGMWNGLSLACCASYTCVDNTCLVFSTSPVTNGEPPSQTATTAATTATVTTVTATTATSVTATVVTVTTTTTTTTTTAVGVCSNPGQRCGVVFGILLPCCQGSACSGVSDTRGNAGKRLGTCARPGPPDPVAPSTTTTAKLETCSRRGEFCGLFSGIVPVPCCATLECSAGTCKPGGYFNCAKEKDGGVCTFSHPTPLLYPHTP